MKKVLIITYYWPPSGGSGVQRWLKMSKYLPEFGWQPVIYTADNAEYPVEDHSLEKDIHPETVVLKQQIIEPYNFYKRFLGVKKEEKIKAGFINEGKKKSSWKENISLWVRGNFFIPDARCLWIKPSVKYLLNYLKDNPVDAIISTGPPHSMHLIAMKLHEKTNIPWLADFRDPWTEIDFYQDLHLTRCADRKHHKLEHEVLTKANKVVTVGWSCAEGLDKLGAEKAEVVANGFDLEINSETMPHSSKFTISHIGVIPPNRNSENLWAVLGELASENEEFASSLEIKLIGQVDRSVINSIENNKLQDNLNQIPYLSHDEAIAEQQKSSLLLLLLNNVPAAKGIMTGKLFEYLAARRPILVIGPEDGDAAKVLDETKSGKAIDFDDKEKMKKTIFEYFNDFKEGKLVCDSDISAIKQYSRRNLAGKIAGILQRLNDKEKDDEG